MGYVASAGKTLLVIVGPTAVGKTALAIKLAVQFNTVIISADSRQFYREMSIGTAKPSHEELSSVKHYFINSHSINESFTAGDFEKQSLALLDDLFKIHNVVILAGGSGLYVKAVCEGFDEFPETGTQIREKLNNEFSENGIEVLQEKLKIADPAYYQTVDINNPQRLIRALEVYESTGIPYSVYRKSILNTRAFNIVKLGLNLPRPVLYERINERVDIMVKQGLIAEVQSLLPFRNLNPLNTVGYTELFDFFDGKTDLNTAISSIKQNTRRFAKRQLTWFRKDKEINWVADELISDIGGSISDLLRKTEI